MPFPKPPRTRSRPKRKRLDPAYKLLFSHPEVVRDLIVGFLDPFGSERFDLDTLEMVPTEFVGGDLKLRRSDLVWRVRLREEGRYIFLLLEIQNRVDRKMIARLSEYRHLLHQLLSRNPAMLGPPSDGPPIIIPVTIHSSRAQWPDMPGMVAIRGDGSETAAWESMFLPGITQLHTFRLDLQHFPLNYLQSPDNLVAYLMVLERREQCRESVAADLRGLMDLLRSTGNAGLAETWRILIKEILPVNSHALKTATRPLDQQDGTESELMDWDDPAWAQEWIEEGIEIGRETGRTEGIATGRAEGIATGRAEGIATGRAEGIATGRATGRAEGIETGREEALNAIRKRLCRQAESRFDPKAAGLLAHRLEQVIDLDRLMEVSEQLMEGKSCAALLQGLASRS